MRTKCKRVDFKTKLTELCWRPAAAFTYRRCATKGGPKRTKFSEFRNNNHNPVFDGSHPDRSQTDLEFSCNFSSSQIVWPNIPPVFAMATIQDWFEYHHKSQLAVACEWKTEWKWINVAKGIAKRNIYSCKLANSTLQNFSYQSIKWTECLKLYWIASITS